MVIESSKGDVTRLLIAWSAGDRDALDRLMPLVQAKLRRIASNHLRGERANPTLQPTELVHEAFLKLVDQSQVSWQERRQFYAIVARLMRRVLVDRARSRAARKRSGEAVHLTWSDGQEPAKSQSFDVLIIDQALERLSRIDTRQASLVELRFFGGFSFEEAGEMLEISPATAKRDWIHARAWLYRELTAPASRLAERDES